MAKFDFEVKLVVTMRVEMADLLTFREKLHEEDLVKLQNVLIEPDMGNTFTLFFDGAFCRATNISVGRFIIQDPKGERVQSESITLSKVKSNNESV